MLHLNQLTGFWSNQRPAYLLARDTSPYTSSTAQASYTSSSRSFGNPSPSRLVIAFVTAHGGTVRSVNSASIGGVTATVDAHAIDSTGGYSGAIVLSAYVPTGTTGTVSITFSGNVNGCSISVMAVDNVRSQTPVDSKTNNGASGSIRSVSVNWNADGVVVGVVTSAESRTFTWTDLTEAYDTTYSAGVTRSVSVADLFPLTPVTAETVTATLSSSSSVRQALSVVSYR